MNTSTEAEIIGMNLREVNLDIIHFALVMFLLKNHFF